MFNSNITIIIFLIVVSGIFFAIFSNGNYNNTTNTAISPNTSNSKSELKEQIQVIYDGSWNGSITQGYTSNSVKGTGNIVYGVTGKIVSANIQKQDANDGTLTVNFLYNGNIVDTVSNSSSYGIVQTAYTY